MIIRDTLPKIGNLVKGPIGPRPTKVWMKETEPISQFEINYQCQKLKLANKILRGY